mmetsp:Transcript_64941/g.173140  ORF Transcript_64941/g.173140 Transcript_64941/m.173140 type:complete len:205 (-) Transcript_64941:240-854(-)
MPRPRRGVPLLQHGNGRVARPHRAQGWSAQDRLQHVLGHRVGVQHGAHGVRVVLQLLDRGLEDLPKIRPQHHVVFADHDVGRAPIQGVALLGAAKGLQEAQQDAIGGGPAPAVLPAGVHDQVAVLLLRLRPQLAVGRDGGHAVRDQHELLAGCKQWVDALLDSLPPLAGAIPRWAHIHVVDVQMLAEENVWALWCPSDHGLRLV